MSAAAAACASSSSSLTFIDIGANLLDDVFQGRYHGGSQKHEPDLDAVLERASAAGVEKVCGSVVCLFPMGVSTYMYVFHDASTRMLDTVNCQVALVLGYHARDCVPVSI